MTNYFTTDKLIENMSRRGFIPAGRGLTTPQILEILTQELSVYVCSFLKGIREEYLVVQLDIPVTSATISAPVRAVGASFRTVQWIDVSGRPFQLPRIEPERVPNYTVAGTNPAGYMLQGNNIVLVPAFKTGTLRVSYQQRPGQLVTTDACLEIATLSTVGSTTTLTFANAVPATFVNGTVIDLVASTPNFQALQIDQSFRVAGGPIYSLQDAPTSLKIGDFICLAGETCIPQIPEEVMSLLAQVAAVKVAQAQGSDRYPQLLQGLKDMEKQLTVLLAPRVDGSARPVVNKYAGGFGRFGIYGGR